MSTFNISGNPDELIPIVFPVEDGGRIRFGFAGRSAEQHASTDVTQTPIQINDYIMEGFIKYRVFARSRDGILSIDIEKLGSNRDKDLDWFVRRWIESLGCVIESESETTS